MSSPTEAAVDSTGGIDPGTMRYPGVTRLLCATAHLLPGFADWVRSELVSPGTKANIPCPGIDLLAVAQHAYQARARREQRDRWLQRLLIVWPLILLLVLWTIGTSDMTFGSGLFLVLLALVVIPIIAGILVGQHIVLANASAMAVMYPPKTSADGLEIIGIDPSARALAPDLPAAQQEAKDRLNALRDANTVVFGGDSPFVGSGRLYDSWTLTIDTRRGPKAIDPAAHEFRPSALHSYLEHHVPMGTTPSRMPDLRTGRRLYVSGWALEDFPELLVDPKDVKAVRPKSYVDPEKITRIIDAPPLEGARAYSFFEMYGWRGQLQPSVYVRISQSEDVLFIEATTFLLSPIGRAFYDVERLTMHRPTERQEVFLAAWRTALPMLFRAPYRNWTRWNNGRKGRLRQAMFVKQIRLHRLGMNQGGTTSVRQVASHLDQDFHFALADEAMYFQLINMRILDCIREFLVLQQIDTAVFEAQYLNIYTGITKGVRKQRGAKGMNSA